MTIDTLGRPTMTDRQQAARDRLLGPPVDTDLLIALIQTTIDTIGKRALCDRAGISERQLHAVTTGEYRARLYFADRLLTRGMGRPDLVLLVCPVERL